MKGLKAAARESQIFDRTWLYYDWSRDEVNTHFRGDCVTLLLGENSEKEIRQIVERWKRS